MKKKGIVFLLLFLFIVNLPSFFSQEISLDNKNISNKCVSDGECGFGENYSNCPEDCEKYLSPDYVSDKIVTHSVSLLDQYIKEIDQPSVTFPNGTFKFDLENNYSIEFSPAYVGGKIFITFTKINLTSGFFNSIVLDGPVYGEPGEIKPELVKSAKKYLSEILMDANMTITKIERKKVNFVLRDIGDFEEFIKLIHKSILIENKLSIESENITDVLPKGTKIEIFHSAGEKNNLKINEKLTFKSEIKTTILSGDNERDITIKLNKEKTEIETKGSLAKITNEFNINNSKLYVKTSKGKEIEIKIMPDTISQIVTQKLNLESCSIENNCLIEIKETEIQNSLKDNLIYELSAEKEVKILGIFRKKIKLKTEVSVETGEIISIKKPWWSFLVK